MREADCIVDIGPLAGENGGEVVAIGTAQELMDNPNSITGAYLSGKKEDSGSGSTQTATRLSHRKRRTGK